MSPLKTLVSAAKMSALAGCLFGAFSASAAQITLVNADFEAGLAGWSTIGQVVATPSTTVTTFDGTVWTVNAAGTTMAQLNSAPTAVSTIESTLGIAAGTLNSLNTNPSGGTLTDGSALYQSFSGLAGDTVSFAWNYVATDYIPFNDPAYAVLLGPSSSFTVLASIQGLGTAVGTSGNSGWNTFTGTLAADGVYTLAFITTNDKDTILNSVLHIDGSVGTCTPNCPPLETPEPATISILGLGLAGLALSRRRKQA